MTESNLPTTGEELEVKNEFPATGEKKQQGETSLWWFFYCLVTKYTLILVLNFLDHFDLNVLRNPLNTPVLER